MTIQVGEGNKRNRLCIATCTRGRPEALLRMLESFTELDLNFDAEVMVLIVENDVDAMLADTITETARKLPVPLHYFWEPRLGIPVARNRCIQEANVLGASHVIFIDDKERAHPSWISSFWSFAQSLGHAAFVEGQVQSIMPEGVPAYLGEFFQREVKQTGALLASCTTANVFMPLALMEEHQLSFDETDPFAGGTDTKLFTSAKKAGVPLYYCAEALVYEDLPAERFHWRWLSKRRFRCGVTEGELQGFETSGARKSYVLKRALSTLSNALKSALYLLFSRQKALKYYLKAYRKAGELMGATGHRVQSYQSVDGR